MSLEGSPTWENEKIITTHFQFHNGKTEVHCDFFTHSLVIKVVEMCIQHPGVPSTGIQTCLRLSFLLKSPLVFIGLPTLNARGSVKFEIFPSHAVQSDRIHVWGLLPAKDMFFLWPNPKHFSLTKALISTFRNSSTNYWSTWMRTCLLEDTITFPFCWLIFTDRFKGTYPEICH